MEEVEERGWERGVWGVGGDRRHLFKKESACGLFTSLTGGECSRFACIATEPLRAVHCHHVGNAQARYAAAVEDVTVNIRRGWPVFAVSIAPRYRGIDTYVCAHVCACIARTRRSRRARN